MEKEKKVVLVDMDDTICHLIKECVRHHNIRWPDHLMEYEKCDSWNHDHLWHPECNIESFFGPKGLYENLPLFDEDVVEEMGKIHKDYELIIVTAAWPTTVLEKWNWLQKHLPFIPHDNFCAWKKKYRIDADLLIDDGPHNLIPFAKKGRAVIGIPHPWNIDIQDQCYFKRDGWKGMKDKIDEILK